MYLLQAIPQNGRNLDLAAEEAGVLIIKVKNLNRMKIQQNLLKHKVLFICIQTAVKIRRSENPLIELKKRHRNLCDDLV